MSPDMNLILPTIANKATSLPKYEYSRELLAEEARVAAEEAEAAEETFFDAEETFFDVEESFTGEPPPSHPSSSEKQGKSTIRLEEGVPPLASEKVASPARSADPVSPVTSPGV